MPVESPGRTSATTEKELIILKWLDDNIDKRRFPKQLHLYIHGPPNTGKSSFVEFLRQRLRVYDLPKESFFDMWDNNAYDVICADEFVQNTHSRDSLTLFLDGYNVTLRKKGAQIRKTFNCPAIFLSNFSLPELYKGVDLLAMQSRFIEVELTPDDNLLRFRHRFMFPLDLEANEDLGPPNDKEEEDPNLYHSPDDMIHNLLRSDSDDEF